MNIEEKNKRKENFEVWLFTMSDVLEEFIESFLNETNHELDYSSNSLILLEKYIHKNFSVISELNSEDNKFKYDVLTRYLGETIRKNIGGIWKLDIENEKSAYYKLPVLIDDIEKPTPICPHKLISACIIRKKEDFLYRILDIKMKKNETA